MVLVSRKIQKMTIFNRALFVALNSNFIDSGETLLLKNPHTIIFRKRSNVMTIKYHWWATRGLWKGDFDICGDLRRPIVEVMELRHYGRTWQQCAVVKSWWSSISTAPSAPECIQSLTTSSRGKEIKSDDTIRLKWLLWARLFRLLLKIFQIWKMDLILHFLLFPTVSR